MAWIERWGEEVIKTTDVILVEDLIISGVVLGGSIRGWRAHSQLPRQSINSAITQALVVHIQSVR